MTNVVRVVPFNRITLTGLGERGIRAEAVSRILFDLSAQDGNRILTEDWDSIEAKSSEFTTLTVED